MTELNPLLTSWRQVYWIWYGATFSSPLISTLICRRIAPDTADLSVRFSRRKNHQQLHALFMFRAQPSWGKETGKETAGSSSWACDQSHHGVNFRPSPFKILKDWLYANLSDSKCAIGSLNLDSVSWTRTCKNRSLFCKQVWLMWNLLLTSPQLWAPGNCWLSLSRPARIITMPVNSAPSGYLSVLSTTFYFDHLKRSQKIPSPMQVHLQVSEAGKTLVSAQTGAQDRKHVSSTAGIQAFSKHLLIVRSSAWQGESITLLTHYTPHFHFNFDQSLASAPQHHHMPLEIMWVFCFFFLANCPDAPKYSPVSPH